MKRNFWLLRNLTNYSAIRIDRVTTTALKKFENLNCSKIGPALYVNYDFFCQKKMKVDMVWTLGGGLAITNLQRPHVQPSFRSWVIVVLGVLHVNRWALLLCIDSRGSLLWTLDGLIISLKSSSNSSFFAKLKLPYRNTHNNNWDSIGEGSNSSHFI